MAKSVSKSQTRRIDEQKKLRSFFYPKTGLGGTTIKAETKEDADKIVADLANPKTKAEEIDGE